MNLSLLIFSVTHTHTLFCVCNCSMIVSALQAYSDNETWILTIPLIHIVSGTDSLQHRPENRHTPDWWGVALFQKEVNAQKRSRTAK